MISRWATASLRPVLLPVKSACFGTNSVFSCRHPLSLSCYFLWPKKNLSSYFTSPSVIANFYASFHILAASTPRFIFSKSASKKWPFPTDFLFCSLSQSFRQFQCRHHKAMDLSEVIEVLESLAPLSLAESWDNVGLLVEPSKPLPVKVILLTNDLTAAVMDEAEAMNCDLIISYHPPLFRPMKRLVQKDWKQQLAIRAVRAGLAVYSPHTALDSMRGGVNDWLIGGVGSGCVSVVSQAVSSAPQSHKLEFSVRNEEELHVILAELKDTGVMLQYTSTRSDGSGDSVSLTCPDSALPAAVETLSRFTSSHRSLTVQKLSQPPLLGFGQGRRCVLDEPVSIATAVQRMKSHLGLSHVRLALGALHTLETEVSSVAVCAGSGGSVLKAVKADLFITGEMSHHDVLDAVAAGTSVILTEHSNSERGFLSVLRERLSVRLSESVTIVLSERDRDPLEII